MSKDVEGCRRTVEGSKESKESRVTCGASNLVRGTSRAVGGITVRPTFDRDNVEPEDIALFSAFTLSATFWLLLQRPPSAYC